MNNARLCVHTYKLWFDGLIICMYYYHFQPPDIDDFVVLKPISRGAFGCVFILIPLASYYFSNNK